MMVNALEDVMRSVYTELRRGKAEFCPCQRCADDVLTLALNQAKPRYVVGDPLGAAVTRVALSQDQVRAELAVIVFAAMRRVAANPNHAARASTTTGGATP